MINKNNLVEAMATFKNGYPFDHAIVDNFFDENVANKLEDEFLGYEDERWFFYNNAIENKKALNDWRLFPETTYNVFRELMSPKFVDLLSDFVGMQLYVDPSLHGGGWHIHGTGGVLNPHLDYSIHPKAKLQRKLNIIVYLSSDLKPEHGGHLGMWINNNNAPGKLIKEVEPTYNRAVIFDTTQDSWHGMSRKLTQPNGIYRKSIAVYYLTEPTDEASQRNRALFAPTSEQINDDKIIKLIIERSKS